MIRYSVLFGLGFFLLSLTPAEARINSLEPWSPGVSLDLPKKADQGVILRLGSGSHGTDMTELAYSLSLPVSTGWEVGGTWGLASLDSNGARDDSGLTDFTLGAKYRFSNASIPGPAKAIVETSLSLPTGDPDKGLGAGGLGLGFSGAFSAPIAQVTGHVQAGLRVFTEGSGTRWGRVIHFTFGGYHRLTSEWTAGGDLRIINHGRDKINDVSLPDSIHEVYLAPGGKWTPKNTPVSLEGAFLLGLSGDAYDFGLSLGARF
jgi:hypothetical protein